MSMEQTDYNKSMVMIAEFVQDNNNHDKLPSRKLKIFGYGISDIKWQNVTFLLFLYIFSIYGFVHALLAEIKFFTVIFAITLSLFSGLAITVGMFILKQEGL